MPRALFIVNHNATIYNVRRELLQRLVGNGFEVFIAVPTHERNQAFRDLGCNVIDTPLSRFGTNPIIELSTIARFVKVIRKVRPDVVLTYTVKANAYGGIAAQVCRVPYIGTVTGLGAVFQSPGLLQRISANLQRLAFRKAHKVFFQNSTNLETFRNLSIVGEQAALVPGSGVNLKLHSLEPYSPDQGITRFIAISRIRRDKGFDELFEAVRRICSDRTDVAFDVVGWYDDESYREVVADMQAHFPVDFHHDVTQERVHELISHSHCLLHPSHHEGMANVILEAAAAGVPCIASDIPGCREAVEEGVTGWLHAAGDVDSLTDEITNFLHTGWETRRSIGLAARRKMEAQFDRERVVDQYVSEILGAIETQQQEVA